MEAWGAGDRGILIYSVVMGTARDNNRKRSLTIKTKQLLQINIWGWTKGFMSLDF